MEVDIKTTLTYLNESLRKIKFLTEWVKLKRIENRNIDPFNRMYDSTDNDLRMEIWHFLARLNALYEYAKKDAALKTQLAKIAQEFRQLNLPIPL